MLRLGYLDVTLAYFEAKDAGSALCSWTEGIGWVCARHFEMQPGDPVPLISSTSELQVDRIATEALKRAKRPYRIVFSAVDFGARFAAVTAGLGYMPLTRRMIPAHLAIEEQKLPPLGTFQIGIFVREEFEMKGLQSLIDVLQAVARAGSLVA